MPRSLQREDIDVIVRLRKQGHSLPEIKTITGKANGTVFKYTKNVAVDPEFRAVLKQKQGGSKRRAKLMWDQARADSRVLIQPPYTHRELLLVLAALYWAEGTKGELNIINGDPYLLAVCVRALLLLGVKVNDFKVSLRLYDRHMVKGATEYWSSKLGVPKEQFRGIELVPGKKEKQGKLPYGMCRVRVVKGGQYFKTIMSMIGLIQSELVNSPRSSMDRTSHS